MSRERFGVDVDRDARREPEPPITLAPPEPRARCRGCDKPRTPTFYYVDADGNRVGWRAAAIGRVFSGWKGYGAFCTQRCAVAWANAVARAYPKIGPLERSSRGPS